MGKKKQEMVEDASGNRVPKGSKTDPEMVAQREAAAKRRAEKAAAREAESAGGGGDALDGLRKLDSPITIGGGDAAPSKADADADEEGGAPAGVRLEPRCTHPRLILFRNLPFSCSYIPFSAPTKKNR